MSDWNKALATEIAKGLINTGIEGGYDSVAKSTAYDYPSIGVSQWEGNRANELLRAIPGGAEYADRTYIDIKASGELPMLKELLRSEAGQQAQLEQLSRDCLQYVEVLQQVPTLDDTRCIIYAGMWCPTSTWVVKRFWLTDICTLTCAVWKHSINCLKTTTGLPPMLARCIEQVTPIERKLRISTSLALT